MVVYKFDRFSRNVEDGAAYRLVLRNRGIYFRSATEATDESPAGKFLTTMLGAVGKFDNDTRTERTLTGMKNRLESGRWQWPAPTGYLTGTKLGPSLVIDSIRGPLIAKMFTLLESGEHTKASALATVTALGLRSHKGSPLTQENVRKILVNPIYAGEVFIQKWGKSVQGDFEPLVPKATFDRVQMVLTGRAPAPVPHLRERSDFPLRGFLMCSDCGLPVTANLSTGKLKKKFAYYRCHRAKGHMNVSAKIVEGAFVDLLLKLKPKAERLDLIDAIFRRDGAQNCKRRQSLQPRCGRNSQLRKQGRLAFSTSLQMAISVRKTSRC